MPKHRNSIARDPLDISPKVGLATVAAAVATIGVWAIESGTGIDIPQLVEGAITTVLVFVGGYLPYDKAGYDKTTEQL